MHKIIPAAFTPRSLITKILIGRYFTGRIGRYFIGRICSYFICRIGRYFPLSSDFTCLTVLKTFRKCKYLFMYPGKSQHVHNLRNLYIFHIQRLRLAIQNVCPRTGAVNSKWVYHLTVGDWDIWNRKLGNPSPVYKLNAGAASPYLNSMVVMLLSCYCSIKDILINFLT